MVKDLPREKCGEEGGKKEKVFEGGEQACKQGSLSYACSHGELWSMNCTTRSVPLSQGWSPCGMDTNFFFFFFFLPLISHLLAAGHLGFVFG